MTALPVGAWCVCPWWRFAQCFLIINVNISAILITHSILVICHPSHICCDRIIVIYLALNVICCKWSSIL